MDDLLEEEAEVDQYLEFDKRLNALGDTCNEMLRTLSSRLLSDELRFRKSFNIGKPQLDMDQLHSITNDISNFSMQFFANAVQLGRDIVIALPDKRNVKRDLSWLPMEAEVDPFFIPSTFCAEDDMPAFSILGLSFITDVKTLLEPEGMPDIADTFRQTDAIKYSKTIPRLDFVIRDCCIYALHRIWDMLGSDEWYERYVGYKNLLKDLHGFQQNVFGGLSLCLPMLRYFLVTFDRYRPKNSDLAPLAFISMSLEIRKKWEDIHREHIAGSRRISSYPIQKYARYYARSMSDKSFPAELLEKSSAELLRISLGRIREAIVNDLNEDQLLDLQSNMPCLFKAFRHENLRTSIVISLFPEDFRISLAALLEQISQSHEESTEAKILFLDFFYNCFASMNLAVDHGILAALMAKGQNKLRLFPASRIRNHEPQVPV